jgi:hypothetical protein
VVPPQRPVRQRPILELTRPDQRQARLRSGSANTTQVDCQSRRRMGGTVAAAHHCWVRRAMSCNPTGPTYFMGVRSRRLGLPLPLAYVYGLSHCRVWRRPSTSTSWKGWRKILRVANGPDGPRAPSRAARPFSASIQTDGSRRRGHGGHGNPRSTTPRRSLGIGDRRRHDRRRRGRASDMPSSVASRL